MPRSAGEHRRSLYGYPGEGRTAMAAKENFTSDQWAKVVASPMLASAAITAADPSGLWGLFKEALSSGWALLEVKQDQSPNSLARAVADAMNDADTRRAAGDWLKSRLSGVQAPEMKTRAISELRDVAALVREKAPDDASSFLAWLASVAQRAAEAGNEGGFLGFGGVAVSDAERATLSEIKSALGVQGGATS